MFGTIITALLFIILTVILVYFKVHNKNSIIPNESKLMILFYPISIAITKNRKVTSMLSNNKKLNYYFKQLYHGKEIGEQKRIYDIKRIAFIICIFYIFLGLSFFTSVREILINPLVKNSWIKRSKEGELTKSYHVEANIKEDTRSTKKEIIVEVHPKVYTEEELDKQIQGAKEYISTAVLGKNEDLNQIEHDLNLIKEIPRANIQVEWEINNQWITWEGKVKNQNMEGREVTTITAILKYREERYYFEIPICVIPRKMSDDEKIEVELKEALTLADEETKSNPYFKLPGKIKSAVVAWKPVYSNNSTKLIVIGFFLSGFLFKLKEKEIEEQIKKRSVQMMKDYSEVVNKLMLLLGAGMTIKGAWNKMANDYKIKKKAQPKEIRYVYEEILHSCNELKSGVSEVEVYEQFGRRCNLAVYVKLSTLLIQNIKKGTQSLRELLEQEVGEAFERRKENAKRLGEEASTKLLLPMMIMFSIVLIIIMVPAILSF